MDHLLSIVLLTPLAGLLVLLFLPASNAKLVKLWSNLVFLIGFLVSIPLWTGFDASKDYQFVEKAPWIPSLGASYHLGIDGYALLLVMLTTLIGPIAMLCSWSSVEERLKEYYGNFMVLQTAMLGVFMARDFLLFFVFWELSLVPMYFIIAIWGSTRRIYSATKFVLYTLIGSVFMLLGGLVLYRGTAAQGGHPSFDFDAMMQVHLAGGVEWWVFWALFVGFAVKVPMWPLHTWLPDAHTDAPTAGSVILAAILLKMGTYGLLRLSIPMLPNAAKDPQIISVVALLSIIAIVYGALVSLMQKDWKRLVAYSSVSHMGFVTLAMFSLNPAGISGSILQQINHGVSTGMLFLIVGVVYDQKHTREIAVYGGLYRVMPLFTASFLIAALSSMGLPPFNGFIGELTILRGVYEMSFWWAFFSGVGIILGAAYLLWLFQRTCLGPLKDACAGMTDMNWRQMVYFAPLLFLAFYIGLRPEPFFKTMERSVAQVVERVRPGYYVERGLPNPLAPQTR